MRSDWSVTVGCSKEFLEKSYAHAENLRMQILGELYKIQDEMAHWNVLKEDERFELAQADYDGAVLRIVVRDVLPRYVSGVKNSLMRTVWAWSIIRAVERLRLSGADPRFTKALCRITVYHHLDTRWDIDNRAFKYLVNGLVAAQVIPDDSWQNLSLMVTGKHDKEHPRTEIELHQLPQEIEGVAQPVSTLAPPLVTLY